MSSHLLTLPELKLLIDAVESSKFITAKKSAELIEKLSRMSSIYQAAELKSNLYVSERVKSFNEQIYYLVDNINTAINHGKQISFRYFHFDQHRKEVPNNGGKRSGQLKAQTPVPLKRFISSVKHKSSPISTQAEALAGKDIMEAPRIPFRERSASIAVLVFHSLNLSTEISINPIGSSCRNMTM